MSPAIDSTMLAAMREAIAELLPDTCSVLSKTSTPDGMGGQTTTWGTLSTVACRVDIQQGREQVAGGGVQAYVRTVLSLPYDTTITEAHRVYHGGVTYAVIEPPNTDQSWIAVKRVELEKVS